MSDDDAVRPRDEARLLSLEVADPPDAWEAAGFAVDGDRVRLGDVVVRLVDGPAGGIVGWTLSGIDLPLGATRLDGLPTVHVAAGTTDEAPEAAPAHPNGATGLDHVVVMTPALERTIEALEAAGLSCRRIRETTTPDGSPLRQAFFRLGATVLEVVGGPPVEATSDVPTTDEAPARWWGLAVDVADLDRTAAVLGAGLGRVKGAVQRGRRIATVRQRDLGLSVAVALMDDHGDR